MNLENRRSMSFREAWFALLNGEKVKLPSWSGYWAWESGTIMMHCKDGSVIDLRKTQNVAYTFSNVASNDWMIAEGKNGN